MPQKSKLNAEEKVEIIRKYQQGEISLAQAAREASVETATIYRWSTRYEAEGAGGFLSYQKNRVYPSELKLKAVQEYLSGSGSLREISKKYKLRNERQLSNWIKVYHAHGDFNSVKFSGRDDSVGLIEREKRRKKGERDLDVTSLLEEALQQGIWAALYI